MATKKRGKTKVCPDCKKRKITSKFHKNSKSRDGKSYYCKECSRARQLTWRNGNPEKISSYAAKNKERMYFGHVSRKYGMSEQEFRTLLKEQNSRCAICSTRISLGAKNRFFSPHVDHCHETGKIRGLLCGKCNAGIALLGDNYDGVIRAAEYLKS